MKRAMLPFIIFMLFLVCSLVLSYTYIQIIPQQLGEGRLYICKLPVSLSLPEANKEYSAEILIDPETVPLWGKRGYVYATLDENGTQPIYYWVKNSTTIWIDIPPTNSTSIKIFIWYCGLDNPYKDYENSTKFLSVYKLPHSLENTTVYLKFK
ncbi:hypothetical protein K1720_00465 [Thermococcus argininiproducens]|uniref:DUF2341 domain-containing protein n=1 Tax=Thermococcus argininiproducens TaxID=2866384 RepID=A0A9E7MA69_9EURY|nr:hypothetical protein [Thermococcus argininiproducens]USG99998.1 hypothetical protein K1720_00465 [Thermococcus argininiproducens]